ncbi:HTH-type transcriptional repressor PurR [Bacteroidia bacterium]|nr:HTH-type transcriptional repressor PurR [Bacteroidia bacterium]
MYENNTNKPVTIKSIAKELGISFSTVSKALNHNPVIKEETRETVLQKAKEMGYIPNPLAQGLKNNSTKTIAVIFNDIENPVLTYIFKNISIEMEKHGYTTMIFDSQFSERQERANILTALSRQPDFVILEPAITNSQNIELLSGIHKKLILQGARYDSVNCHHVHIDYAQGGYFSACEMLENGHRNCLVITEPLSFPISEQFVIGIEKAYQEYGLIFDRNMIKATHSTIPNGCKVIQELWDYEAGNFSISFTGVLTFDDGMAYGVYKAASQLGFRVPEDISVIGFDDNPFSAFSMPPLTTIHLPKERMAESCISILNSVLLGNQSDMCIYSLEPYLVKRESVYNLAYRGGVSDQRAYPKRDAIALGATTEEEI